MDIFQNLFLLQRLDYYIRIRASGSPAQLAARLNVSKRNVFRLLGALREQGFPIAFDKQLNTYFYETPVRLHFEVTVDGKKLLVIRQG